MGPSPSPWCSQSPTVIPTCNITIHCPSLEQVNIFIYLGSMFPSDGKCVQDVRRRIGIAKSAFTALEKVLKSRDINLQLRIRVLKCYVWSRLLYGLETWTLTSDLMKQLEERSIENCHRMHTNIQHLHDETLTLPIHEHLQLHASQYKQ